MKLAKFQDDILEKTTKLMNDNNLIEDEDYAQFTIQEGEFKTGMSQIIIYLQLRNEEKIVKQLKKLGWRISHKYYTNGQVSYYNNGDSKNDYGNVEMIQLVVK